MSSDNALSAVTYTSVSSDSNGPSSWGILLVNAGEIPEMDPYEEVAQQEQTHPLSPAYVEDQPYVDDASPTAGSPGYIANSNSMEEDIDAVFYWIFLIFKGMCLRWEEDEDDEEEEDEHLAPADSSVVPVVDRVPSAGDTEAFETDESDLNPRSPRLKGGHATSGGDLYLCSPPGCDVAESYATAARAPRGQYDFVDAVEAGQGLIRSPGHDVRTIARAADRAEDVGLCYELYRLLGSHRMMTSLRKLTLRDSYQAWALLARLETLETHMSRMEWSAKTRSNNAMTPESIQAMIDWAIQRNSTQDDGSQSSGGGIRRPVQPARVCSYPDFMKCQPLNFKGTEGVVGLSQWLEKMESVFHISGCAIDNQVKFATFTLLGAALTCEIKKLKIEMWNLKVRGNDVAAYTQRFQELALMCTKFLVDETVKIDKYIGGLPDNIHGNVMFARPKTLDFAIELANNLMGQKLRTYAERQNENKRKADDSSRNNHQQQHHKKQNVARAYTAGPGEKKVYTRDLPLCTKCNYHHTGQCAPKCGKCKRYGHATTDCRVNANNNNNNMNQKAEACYECGNTGHMKRNCPKLKNHGNGNGNGAAQGRAYALGGRDASSDPNVITSMFLLNDRYAKILFDTGADRSFAQEYLSKGCDVFLAHVTTKEAKDKSEGKRLEDVPIVRDFLEVFPEDLQGIPPARQVEFQIDSVPG
ncbi:putative reverse transcriptase domain-containing protein, partial [Tanacetum coccineum]